MNREAFGVSRERGRGRVAEKQSLRRAGHGRSRCENAVKSGLEQRVAAAPGALVMLMWGGPRPARRSPAPLGRVIRQDARGAVRGPARFDIHLPSPAIVSFLGPGKRVATFAVNNEF